MPEQYIIHGGKPLHGKVLIGGAKNASLPIIAASLLADGPVVLQNVPDISDVRIMLNIIEKIGAKVQKLDEHTYQIDPSRVKNQPVLFEEVGKMRASYYLLGVLLGRFGQAETLYPGGCNLGLRPIDLHIKGFSALGASVTTGTTIALYPERALQGTKIFFDTASVGATINIMLAASRIPGMTIIENAAKEPHVVDTANFLNAMGGNIKGAGTDTVRIKGVRRMHGTTYSVIPDQIEAGTMMVAAAITKGNVQIENVIPKHLEAITAKLRDIGAVVVEEDNAVRVIGRENYKSAKIKTLPYPGFPTDMQPQFTALLSTVPSSSIVTETVMTSRFRFTEELNKMGAEIMTEGSVAIVNGNEHLHGADVKAYDLRAGAAMVLAGLAAEGETRVANIEHIERGYENLVQKLTGIGADIVKRADGVPELRVVS